MRASTSVSTPSRHGYELPLLLCFAASALQDSCLNMRECAHSQEKENRGERAHMDNSHVTDEPLTHEHERDRQTGF